jgi:hypothetical protein
MFVGWVLLFLSLSMPLVNAFGFFSLQWNYPASAQISQHALDSIGETVYFGSADTFGLTNYLYAVNIATGALLWRYNTSLPINYVSNFRNNNTDYIAVGTGGSTLQHSKSFVYVRQLDNQAFWQSVNLNSSIKSLSAATSYVSNGQDVVAGLENGTLLRFRGDTGEILWRQPVTGAVFSISELKNGSIVVGSREVPNMGHVYCFEKNGTLRWESPPPYDPITLVKTFADANGDGEPEVVAVFYDGKVHVLNGWSGNELSPAWPFNVSPDNVKDLLCTEDFTGDDFPDIICGTEDGNLTIIDGLNAQRFREPIHTGYTLISLQYMYSYSDGSASQNKTLAVSLYTTTLPITYYVYGINATDLTLMKSYPVGAQALNLLNVGNRTDNLIGDLIFTAGNSVYYLSGTDIIYSEFSSQILVLSIIVILSLALILQRRRFSRKNEH